MQRRVIKYQRLATLKHNRLVACGLPPKKRRSFESPKRWGKKKNFLQNHNKLTFPALSKSIRTCCHSAPVPRKSRSWWITRGPRAPWSTPTHRNTPHTLLNRWTSATASDLRPLGATETDWLWHQRAPLLRASVGEHRCVWMVDSGACNCVCVARFWYRCYGTVGTLL